MFGREYRKDIQRLRGIVTQPKRNENHKRVSTVLAPASDWRAIKDTQSRYINHQALFIAFEGNKSTCILHISSPKQKSRSSIILFRGRVVSCVYGRRGMPAYIFGDEAFRTIKLDLTHPDSEVAVQAVTEEMALAAASVFEGRSKMQDTNEPIDSFLQSTMSVLLKSKQPGCIQIREKDGQVRYLVYFFDGGMLGFYSSKDGWLKASFDNVIKKVSKSPVLSAQAFMLQTKTISELYEQTFSLTGVPNTLHERKVWISTTEAVDPVKLFEIHAQPAELKNTFKFKEMTMSEQRQMSLDTTSSITRGAAVRNQNSFKIDPWT